MHFDEIVRRCNSFGFIALSPPNNVYILIYSATGTATPIKQSRVTSFWSSVSVHPSVLAGRFGSTMYLRRADATRLRPVPKFLEIAQYGWLGEFCISAKREERERSVAAARAALQVGNNALGF